MNYKKNNSSKFTKGKNNLLVTWYGDDFTGAAGCMEVLTFSGYPSVVFFNIPTPEQLHRFKNIKGLGIAGIARSKPTSWMTKNLPRIFKYLSSLQAPVAHYKVCSTLDSSPKIGSIGKVIDIAQKIFKSRWVPFLIAAPPIRRYQWFGNIFASVFDGVFRLDRHPVMQQHPVTPMDEADVIKHLQKQTKKSMNLISYEDIFFKKNLQKLLIEKINLGSEIFALDVWNNESLYQMGKLIWENSKVFSVGSQGIEYALVEYWNRNNVIRKINPKIDRLGSKQVITISGSVSSITQQQIDWALKHDFYGISLDPCQILINKKTYKEVVEETISKIVKQFKQGKDIIIYTAKGPSDPKVKKYKNFICNKKINYQTANRKIGQTLGHILKESIKLTSVERVIVSGGDTCGYAIKKLDIFAITALAPTVPGASLFKACGVENQIDGLEIALKGGQMGTVDYFGWIKRGAGKNKLKTGEHKWKK